jgi:aryl-alcohol dehydrogenase-like predicted oxidoreductase
MLAQLRGWTKFSALQIEYSLIERTVEKELIPMANELGLSVTPWGPLGGGLLTGKYFDENSEPKRMDSSNPRFTGKNLEIARKVVDVAKSLGFTPAQVALKWVMMQGSNQIPIIGARKLSQLKDSLKALDIEIPSEQFEELNKASEIELGFPHRFLDNERIREIVYGGTYDKIVK